MTKTSSTGLQNTLHLQQREKSQSMGLGIIARPREFIITPQQVEITKEEAHI